MIRTLLFVCLFLTASITLSFAQTDPTLGRASTFTVLAATEIINNGQTGVTGNVGVYPGNTIVNESGITIEKGRAEKGTDIAAGAQADALAAYNSLAASTPAIPLLPVIGRGIELVPGTYKINGNLSLQGVLTLNGLNNLNSVFIIIVDGNLSSNSLTAGIRLVNGAQAKNVYWVVSGGVDFGELSGIQGTFIAKQDVVLHKGVVVSGRAISLNGKVELNQNNLYMPTLVEPNLSISKTAPAGEYVVGDEITYTITVRNVGSGLATGVVVQDIPTANLTFKAGSAVFTDGTFDESNLTWNIGELQFGESRTLNLTFTITGAGKVVNTASADSNETDPEENDDKDEEETEVGCQQVATLAITGDSEVCAGDNNITYTASAIPGATYTYTLSGGLTQVSQTGNTITLRAGTAAGTLQVRATDPCGNTYTATKEITVQPQLETPVIVGLETVCQNSEDLIYSVLALGDGVTYTWATTGDVRITAGANSPAVQVSVGAAGGTLTLEASNTCSTTPLATKTIATTTALTEGPTSITGSSTVCEGQEATYSTGAVIGADNYIWNLPGDWEILSGEGSRSIRVQVGSASGDVSVAASNVCGSTSGVSFEVTVETAPALPEIAGEASGCVGENIVYSVPALAGATSYTWEVPETWTLLNGQNTERIVVEVGTGAGVVSLRIANACGTSEAATLNVAPAEGPVAQNEIVGEAAACEGAQGLTYTLATVEEGVTYNWQVPTGWTIESGQDSGTIVVSAGTAGGDITVVASNACATATPLAKTVTVTPLPATPGTIQDNSNVCDGLAYSVAAATGATSYVWTVPAGFTITSGQGTNSITVKADNTTATGQVTVMALNGTCSSPASSATIDASLANGELAFPKAFSPNGDGINDTWVISNLTKFDKNEVTIFNRWGSEVFRKSNYQNDWRGSNLEQGTYFYKVRVTVCDGVVKEFTGYTTLVR